mmetsp:Transcript_68445/g.205041  ORF Transcript_68445/g.205041 Transcript_68445/m.205041 type:complete len:220 (-) Transcript_68445:68-727(-)
MKLHALSTNGRPAHLQTQTRRPPTPHREYAIRRIQRGARPTGRASPHTPRRPNKASPRHHATTRAGPRRPLGTRRTAHRARSERATPCHPTTQRRVPRTPPRPPPTRKRITRASSDGARGDIMVLVVVAEVESRAERHAPDVGRCDDVAVIIGEARDDDDLCFEEDGRGEQGRLIAPRDACRGREAAAGHATTPVWPLRKGDGGVPACIGGPCAAACRE